MRRRLTIAGLLLVVFLSPASAKAQTELPPETRNAALRYWLAFADLQDPPADKSTQDLLEKTASGETAWDDAKLGAILDQNQRAIQEMQRATKLPECDWGLEYGRGPEASIAYVPRARVLARLNTLYGMRMLARGQTQEAVDAWLDGIRFSRHLAQGGTLIFKLVARMSLLSDFNAFARAAEAGQLDEAQKQEIAATVRALPDDGFDWGEAMAYEEASLEIAVRQMKQAISPAAYYQEILGQPVPADFSIPDTKDLAACRSVFTQAEAALRLRPEKARTSLPDLQGRVTQLHPFFQKTIPSLVRINDARLEIESSRAKLLAATGKS
ncbi:MAG TPA: hypothetical protein VIH46_07865 [Candidatus Acidoferrales bacterium]